MCEVRLLDQLLRRIERLAMGRQRVLLGLVGPPGVGKSTTAALLADELGLDAAIVPMDGFHLADAELARQGLEGRKGAIDTFDGWGFASAIERLAAAEEAVTYLPSFDRRIGDPIAGSIAISSSVPIVIVEGNYLLVHSQPWVRVRKQLDECWYLELDEGTRVEQLHARHLRFGAEPAEARNRTVGNDQRNAEMIEASKFKADLILDVGKLREELESSEQGLPPVDASIVEEIIADD